MSNGAAYLGEYIPCPRLLRESLAERCSERWIESCRQDLLGPIVAVNERPLKRLLSEYVRYHREDRTHLGLEKGTPDGFVPWLRVGSFPRSDSAGCPIVTIERPSPDWPRVLYIYICALYAHSGSCPPESSCCIEAMIIFRLTPPRTAPLLVPAKVLAKHRYGKRYCYRKNVSADVRKCWQPLTRRKPLSHEAKAVLSRSNRFASPLDIRQEYMKFSCRRTRGRMAESTDLLQGTLDLLILKSLALAPMHGWGIAERIQQVSKDALQIGQGSLYPALHRLEYKGWIKSNWGVSENNRRAKFYSLTRTGKKQLQAELDNWDRLTNAIALVLERI